MKDEVLFWREHYKRPVLSGYTGHFTFTDHDYEVMDDDGNIVTKHWSLEPLMEKMHKAMREIRETPSPFWQALVASAKDADTQETGEQCK